MANVHVPGLLIFLCILPIIARSNPESEALLKLKASFTNSTSLDSWRPETEPCAGNGQWVGVACENGVVSGPRLGKLGLSGKIDVDALASLSGLRSVAFMFNAFSGSIPSFHVTEALKGLYLTGNQFSGEIPPDYFSKMEGLRKVWLSSNNFSGPIPSSLARLSQLSELHLENNHFSGLIPSFEQQSLLSINFSYNNLEGEVPVALSRFGNDAFQGNAGLWRKNHSSDEVLVVVFFFVMGCVALAVVMLVVMFFIRRRRDDESVKQSLEIPLNSKKLFISSKSCFGSSIYGGRGRGDGLVFMNEEKGLFATSDLMRAASQVMGNGALRSSFKATLGSGMTVVVKKVGESNKMGKDEFDEKMRWLGSLRHKNVLSPLAYYNMKEERLLVYEYQHKGSLLLLLHDDQGSSLTEVKWPLRLKIIQGIASGLDFLHTELSPLELPHGDLKSSNVLLSQDYEPLLADYGFWSLISPSQAARSLVAFKAPEAAQNSCISPKCDVYLLGIMILEILTRKFPSQYLMSNAQGGADLVVWARLAIAEGREVELLDPDMANTSDYNYVQQMKQLVHIALSCTEDDPDQRLGLREVVSRIEGVSMRAFDVLPSLREGFADDQGHPMPTLQSNGDLSECKIYFPDFLIRHD